jgi:hypothetical protein
MVSATDFTTVALALANDSVKNATAGDFVRITGDILRLSMVILESMPFQYRL